MSFNVSLTYTEDDATVRDPPRSLADNLIRYLYAQLKVHEKYNSNNSSRSRSGSSMLMISMMLDNFDRSNSLSTIGSKRSGTVDSSCFGHNRSGGLSKTVFGSPDIRLGYLLRQTGYIASRCKVASAQYGR